MIWLYALLPPLILGIVYMFVSSSGRKRVVGTTGNVWTKNKDTAITLGALVALLFLIHFVCYKFDFFLWKKLYWSGGAFWTANIAILVAIWTSSMKNKVVRYGAAILAVLVLVGCLRIMFFSPERLIPGGRWTTFEVPEGTRIEVYTEYGVRFKYITNVETRPRASGPNGEFVEVPGKLTRLSINPERDMTAKVLFKKI